MYVGNVPRQRVLGYTHVKSAVPCIRLGSAVSRRPCSRSRHLATFASDGQRARESLSNSSSSSSNAGQQSSKPAAAAAVSSGSSAQHNSATSQRPGGSSSSPQPVSSRDWEFWCEHFELQDLAGSRQDALQPLLAAAVADENYRSAAAIRSEINDLVAVDAVTAVQQQLAAAVAAEQYDLAAVLRDQAWAVLQGWWVCDNPGDEGHLLRVMPEYGRWTGQKYTPTDLVQLQASRKRHQRSNSSSSKLQAVTDQDNMRNLGTPVLEIFVKQQQQNGDNSAATAAAAAAPWISQAVQLRSTFDKDVTAAPTSSGGGDVTIDQAMQNLFKSNAVSLGRSPLADDTAAAAAAGLAAPGSPRTSDMYAAGASVGASFDDDLSQDDALRTVDSAEDDVMQSGDYSPEVPDSIPISDQVKEYASTYSKWIPYLHQSNGSMINIHNTFNDAFLDAAESTLAAAAAAADAASGVLCADGETRLISRQSAAAAARGSDHAPAAAAAAPRLQLVVHILEGQSCVTLGARAISGGTVITRDLETSEIMPPGPRMVPDWSLVVPEQIPGLRARLAASLEAQRLVREMLGGKDGWWKTQLIGTVAPTAAAAAAATGDQLQQQQSRDQGQQHANMTWLLPLQLAHLQQQQRQDQQQQQQQQQWQEQQQQQQDDVLGDPVQSPALSAADMSGFYPDFYHDFAPDYEGLPWQEVLSLIYKQQQQQQEKEEVVSHSSSSSSSPQDQFLLNPQYANLSPQEMEEIHETLEQLKLGSAAAAASSSQQQHWQQQQEDQESKVVWDPPVVMTTQQQQQQQQQLAPVVEQQRQQQQQQQPRGLTRKRPRLNSIASSSSRSRAEAAWESAVAAGMVQTTSSSYSSSSIGDAFEMLFSSELERSPATVIMHGKDSFVIGPDPATHSGSSMAQQQQQSDTAGSSNSKLQDRVFIVEVPVTISDSDQLQQQQQQESGAAGSSNSQGYSRVWQLAAHQVMVQHACSILYKQPSSSSSSGFAESFSSLCLPMTWRQPLADLMAVRAQSVLGDMTGTLRQSADYHRSSSSSSSAAGTATTSSSSSSDVGAATSSSSPVLSISDDAPILVAEIPPELVHQAVAARNAAAVEETAAAAANSPNSSSSSSSDQQGGSCTVPDGVLYRRIKGVNTHQSDPLTGLFLGAFGSHGPELIQVQRSVCLNTGAEQVVGMKLTGDDNVPAGEVTFRAKVGHRHKLSTKGMFAQQLDIVARYPGEGRAARPGFINPRWVPGELLVFNSSSSRNDESFESWIADAQLGFVFDIPGHRRFCVLLNRVALP